MRISELEKAYAMAVKASENPDVPLRFRNMFRAIHYQIWKACGDTSDDQTKLVAAADRNMNPAM